DSCGRPTRLDEVAGQVEWAVTVQRGMTTISLQVLNEKRLSVKGDPRPMLAQLRVGELEFHARQLDEMAASGAFAGNRHGAAAPGQGMTRLNGREIILGDGAGTKDDLTPIQPRHA